MCVLVHSGNPTCTRGAFHKGILFTGCFTQLTSLPRTCACQSPQRRHALPTLYQKLINKLASEADTGLCEPRPSSKLSSGTLSLCVSPSTDLVLVLPLDVCPRAWRAGGQVELRCARATLEDAPLEVDAELARRCGCTRLPCWQS
eukprot:scaffold329003_cov129-Tisochrysis_lutea.AAC.1